MTNVAFVVPYALETSQRFLRGALGRPGVRVGLVSTDPVERFGTDIRQRLAGHWHTEDALHTPRLVAAVQGLAGQMGGVDRLVGVLEHLQVPLAEAREALGLPGMDAATARNFRDKARMKDVLRAADVPCARHGLAHDADEARARVAELDFPVVVKPPEGAGAVATFRIETPDQLEQALARFPPSPTRPMLFEEFVQGVEHSFDSVCIEGKMVWHSISRYAPTPLEVLQTDWIQWCVLLPRHIDGPEFDPIRAVAQQALAALGMGTGLSHMEWFRRADGTLAISEVGPRPPGAQFTSLLSYAHDTDMYSAWARLAIEDRFDPPPRRHAVGAAYLRGQGHGRVKAVHGLERAQAELGSLVVESHLPRKGQPKASSYEGEGYVILRHPDTDVVTQALQRLVSIVQVELG
jgi:biotin carboxylase